MNRVTPTDPRTTGNSLLPPAAEDPTAARTSEIARREIRPASLTPRGQRSEKVFPVAEFQSAVLDSDFIGINLILMAHGFSLYETKLIEGKAKLLSPTLKVGRDLLVDILLHTAIEKSFSSLLPALPEFTTQDPAKLAELARLATEIFCRKMTLESFEVLRAVVKKYRPDNGEECIKLAYSLARDKGQEMFTKPLIRSFPEYHLTDRAEDSDWKDGVEARPAAAFPAFAFRMALTSLSTDDFCRILTRHGWQESDLDIIRLYMNQLKSERARFGKGLEQCTSLSSLDDICSRIINEGLMNRRLSLVEIFPLLPAFNSFNAEHNIQQILKLAEDSLHREPADPFLKEMFSKITAKYPQQ